MTTSGSSVKSEIENIANTLNRDTSQINKEVQQYERKIDELNSEREERLLKLATIYLPELDAINIQNTLREVQNDVQKIFREKQERRTKLVSLMEKNEEIRKSLQDKVNDFTEELNKKYTKRDELSENAKIELGKDSAYEALVKKTIIFKEEIESDEKTLQSTTIEFEKKRAMIENNTRFKYLIKRNYDPAHPKFFDAWIAKAVAYNDGKKQPITYEDMKKTYDYLLRMPELMNRDFEKRTLELKALEEKIYKIEKTASDLVGLTKINEEIEAITIQKKKTESLVNSEMKSYGNCESEIKMMENTKDKYYSEAVQKLKTFLKSQEINDLKARAKATPDTKDDKLVDRIEEIDENIYSLEEQCKKAKEKLSAISDKYHGIRRILSQFDSNDYDSSRSYFDSDFNITSLLLAYLSGKYSERQILSQIDDNHHKRPVQTHSSYSSYGGGSSHHSSGGFGGGFGGGSSIGSGGFGGGARIGGRGF